MCVCVCVCVHIGELVCAEMYIGCKPVRMDFTSRVYKRTSLSDMQQWRQCAWREEGLWYDRSRDGKWPACINFSYLLMFPRNTAIVINGGELFTKKDLHIPYMYSLRPRNIISVSGAKVSIRYRYLSVRFGIEKHPRFIDSYRYKLLFKQVFEENLAINLDPEK